MCGYLLSFGSRSSDRVSICIKHYIVQSWERKYKEKQWTHPIMCSYSPHIFVCNHIVFNGYCSFLQTITSPYVTPQIKDHLKFQTISDYKSPFTKDNLLILYYLFLYLVKCHCDAYQENQDLWTRTQNHCHNKTRHHKGELLESLYHQMVHW